MVWLTPGSLRICHIKLRRLPEKFGEYMGIFFRWWHKGGIWCIAVICAE